MNRVLILIRKEFHLEWKQKYALNGILLYLISTVFIIYISYQVSFGTIDPETWNVLFWIVILFNGINAVTKSFMHQREGHVYYLNQVSKAQHLLISKQIYYSILMILLSLIGFFFFNLILNSPIQDLSSFLSTIVLASIGLATGLTFLSSLVLKARNNSTLFAILGFPILIPIMLLVIRLSSSAILDSSQVLSTEMLLLLAVDFILFGTTYILFPYLWKS